MTAFRRVLAVFLATLGLAPALGAQQAAKIPVRPLGRIVAVSHEMLTSIGGVRPLNDGRVLANDKVGHRVVLFDSSLASFTTVADTTTSTAKAYGSLPGGLFPYTGDSSIFADPASLSLLIIDPAGKIVRTVSAPIGPGGGLGYLVGPQFNATTDGRGDVVYRFNWAARNPQSQLSKLPVNQPGGPPVTIVYADSAVILRANFATKKRDTVATINSGGQRAVLTPAGSNSWSVSVFQNALPLSDDWTVTPDGMLAIVRVFDYHIDWVAPDGTRSSTPKIAHDWERYTDSAKAAIIDSSTRADSIRAISTYAAIVKQAKDAGQPVPSAAQAGLGGPGSVMGTQSLPSDNGTTVNFTVTNGGYGDPSSLPDSRPPFVTTNDSTGTSAVKADADGNIWIRVFQPKPLPGGPVFDVVNRQGVLIDRVQIPGATTIVGFAPGFVYLTSREGAGYHLARARIR